MEKRFLSGIVLVIVVILFLICKNPLIDSIVIFAISCTGIYEYNKAFKSAGYKPISWIGYLTCTTIFLMGGIIPEQNKLLILKCALPVLLIGSFVYIITLKLKRTIVDVAITVFSLLYIPFLFSFIKSILLMENGRFFVLYVFAVAFVGDTFAYIIGKKYGKNKLCPEISPNKTVEGSIAGLLGVEISGLIVTLIGNNILAMNLELPVILIAGVIAGVAGQFGDLAASAIKRYCKIKDFGNIIPGHGGILDRFDSILFIAPIIYIFLRLYM